MKRKIVAFFCTVAILCACLCGTAFAAKKPSVEMMFSIGTWYLDGPGKGASPTIFYRNNTNKAIKYIDWYLTAYNRVGDQTADWSTGESTKKLTTIGPVYPTNIVRNTNYEIQVQRLMPNDNPFKYYKNTNYFVAIGNELRAVYQDTYGNFFIQRDQNNVNSCTYLTEDEIENAMFDTWCSFSGISWQSNVIDHIAVEKAVVTYMDGSTETITNLASQYRSASLQNPPFAQQLAQYQAVYNYQDYLKLNPDLADAFGANQKALFEHFVTNGMKEGRQGSSEFNLNTYKANNPDLVAAFGDDNVKYYEHYISSGKAEGRIAK